MALMTSETILSTKTVPIQYNIKIRHDYITGDELDDDALEAFSFNDLQLMNFDITVDYVEGCSCEFNLFEVHTSYLSEFQEMRENLYVVRKRIDFEEGGLYISTDTKYITFCVRGTGNMGCIFKFKYLIDSKIENILDYMIDKMSKVEQLNPKNKTKE